MSFSTDRFCESVYKPTRMCVACRERFLQAELARFSVCDGQVVGFVGFGRSFYLCGECSNCERKVAKALARFGAVRDKHKGLVAIREIINHG